MMSHEFDDNLFEILKHCKAPDRFLDTIFGFLKRRTDFYVESDGTNKIGLPTGIAEKIAKNAFNKWKNNAPEPIPPAVREEVVETAPPENVTMEEEVLTSNVKKNNINNGIFNASDCYNGATYDNYSWSQSIGDVDIAVKLPENTKSRNLSISVLADKINVRLKSNDSILLEGDFCNKCKPTETIWSVDNNKLLIHLEKSSEIWWNCLVKTEVKLDFAQMDCSRPFEELSSETQAKIEELTWNEERKKVGLPTTEQISMEKMLRKAWDAEGSPFSGPFDPSSVLMN